MLNGGGVPGDTGNVVYLAPDTLKWEDMSLGFGDFLSWLLNGDVAGFYAEQRWSGWEAEVRALQGDQTFSIYPPCGPKDRPSQTDRGIRCRLTRRSGFNSTTALGWELRIRLDASRFETEARGVLASALTLLVLAASAPAGDTIEVRVALNARGEGKDVFSSLLQREPL